MRKEQTILRLLYSNIFNRLANNIILIIYYMLFLIFHLEILNSFFILYRQPILIIFSLLPSSAYRKGSDAEPINHPCQRVIFSQYFPRFHWKPLEYSSFVDNHLMLGSVITNSSK